MNLDMIETTDELEAALGKMLDAFKELGAAQLAVAKAKTKLTAASFCVGAVAGKEGFVVTSRAAAIVAREDDGALRAWLRPHPVEGWS